MTQEIIEFICCTILGCVGIYSMNKYVFNTDKYIKPRQCTKCLEREFDEEIYENEEESYKIADQRIHHEHSKL
jgi:hypothetical protein